jgi:tRNA-dihydrouridine synthase B
MNAPVFKIGEIPVYGDVILAPMDGITTHPFRLLARRHGSAVSYTEFINAIDAVHGRPRMEEHLFFSEEERPLGYQILDNDPQRILQAALILQKRRPDFIDINLGCPARDVCSRGAGAGLLLHPEKIALIFQLLCENLSVPVTAKIRLGWDGQKRNYLEIARLLEENGAAALAVHGRTRQEAYCGAADWDAIAQIKETVAIPVIANGDVKTVTDLERLKSHTGCDAVMVGRSALGNPWIFSRKDLVDISITEKLAVMQEHLALNIGFYGPKYGLVLFRKHALRYLDPYSIPREARTQLVTCEEPQTFLHLLAELNLETVAPSPDPQLN